MDIISAGYNICNSWAGVSATMYVGILAGGSTTVIYGMIIITIFTTCSVLSLAELAARYPSAGGQYHWSWIISPPQTRRVTSYITGVVNIFAWIAIAATVDVLVPNFLFGLIAYHYGFVAQKWQLFLVYQAFNIICLLYNLFFLSRAPWTHDIGFALTLLCMLTYWITCLARASPKASSTEVWTSFVNEGLGWPDGVVFLTGMSNPNYMFAGIDGALHLAEDALNASSAIPWALVATVSIGFVTAFIFVVSMFYCISNPVDVAKSPLPIFEIWAQATGSRTAATIMTSILFAVAFFSLNACQQTASRLTWSFGRDGGVVFSRQISQINRPLRAPVWALLANAFVVFIIGCVYLGNPIAFNAVVGTSLILMQASFAIPVTVLMLSGRDPQHRPRTGRWNFGRLGWLYNFGTVAWALIITVFYCFPTSIPTSSSEMNYAAAVLAVMAIFGTLNWFFYAKKHFKGPQIEF